MAVVIDFSARDNGTQSYMDSMYKKAKQGFSDIASSAAANSKSGKEQLAFLEAQIKLAERRNRLERDAALLAVEQRKKQKEAERDFVNDKINALATDFNSRRNTPGAMSEEEYIAKKKALLKEKAPLSDERIDATAKEEEKTIKDRLKEDEFQTKLLRELIDSINQQKIHEESLGRENVEAFIKGIQDNPNASDKDRLVAALLSDSVDKKKKEEKVDDPLTRAAIGMAAYHAASKVLSGVNSLVGTQTGFDQITNVSSLAGQAGGGLLGMLIGGLTAGPAGAMAGASMGSAAGGAIGELFGGLSQREKQAAEDYGQSASRQAALTGIDTPATGNYSRVGLDIKEMVELQTEVARTMGTRRGVDSQAENVGYLEKGYGIERGISTAMLEMQRSNVGGQKDLLNTVGGILDKGKDSVFAGGDRTMLPEVLQKFTGLQKEFLKTQNSVKDGTVTDMMFRFNKLGGQFAMKDYRSDGLLGGIQNSLANPGSDVMKALSFQALKRLNPDMDIAQIIEERQKGYNSPQYLKSILGSLDQMGGSSSSKIMNIAGAFGLENNMAAARSIFENKDGLLNGSINAEQLVSSTTDKATIEKEAMLRTTLTEKNLTEIQNKITRGMYEGAGAIKTAIEDAFNNSTITMTADGKIKYTPASQNKTPTQKAVVGEMRDGKKVNLPSQWK